MKNPKYYSIVFCIILIIVLVIFINEDEGGIDTPSSNKLYEIPFHINRTNEKAPEFISEVPLKLYQSWHTNSVPEGMYKTIYKLISINSEFDYYLYSDEASRKFIKENYDEEVLNAFDSLKPGAFKSDLWRYCILYKQGGVYLDIKYYSLVPLIDIIKESPVIFTRDIHNNCSNARTGIYNAFMVSPPNNPVFKASIEEIVKSCKLKWYGLNTHDITGPCHLNRIMEQMVPSFNIFNLPTYHGYEGILPYQIITKSPYIYYKGKQIIKGYIEYRKEQTKTSKTDHYSVLWDRKDVYR